MARVKVTGYVELDEFMIDREHPSGLSQAGFDEISSLTEGLEDVNTELVD